MHEIQTRRQLFRWLGWFAMANAVVLGLVSLRYLGGDLSGPGVLPWLYLVTIYISHHSWLALLPLLLLAGPVILLRPSYRMAKTLAVVLMAAMIAVILLDSLLWSQSRFHINMLTLKILGAQSWIFAAVMFAIALVFETLLAGRIWSWVNKARAYRGRLLSAVVVLCLVVSQAIFAWADASYYVPVTSIAQQLPVHRGFTAKRFMVRMGWVNIDESRERQLAKRVAGGLEQTGDSRLAYPVEPLDCPELDDGNKPLNLLVIMLDSMRGGMLGQGVTPHLDRFVENRAMKFSRHFAGGNSSRMGVFSFFYGLSPGYFSSFEALQKPPVLMDELMNRGYGLGLFSSSSMYRPVTLDRTAFARVPNLRVDAKPRAKPAWQRDREMTRDWVQWLDGHQSDKPFFGFLFYDATNDQNFPPEFGGRVKVDPNYPMASDYANYQTSILFVDEQVGILLDDLDSRGLTDQTVVMITSDHGEEFNENGNGISGHGSSFSWYQLSVPMLLAWPGMEPRHYSHRTSHYDVAPTLMRRLLHCQNPVADYASGRDLFQGQSWDWIVAGSYYNYAVLEPEQTTITFPNGLYEVRDEKYRLLDNPDFNADVYEAVMRENTRFHKQ